MLNTRSNDFIRTYIERVTSARVACVPKFHSWDKRTMPVTNINSDWMSNAFSGLRINFVEACVLLVYILPLNQSLVIHHHILVHAPPK